MVTENIDNTHTENDSQLSITNITETKLSSLPTLNATANDSSLLYIDYHNSEIEQNKKIYGLAKTIIWVGFGVMMLGVVACYFGVTTATILTSVAGVITEIISGIILTVLSQSSKTKKEYYKQLSFDQELDKYIALVKNINLDYDDKREILNKLVDNYCRRRK